MKNNIWVVINSSRFISVLANRFLNSNYFNVKDFFFLFKTERNLEETFVGFKSHFKKVRPFVQFSCKFIMRTPGHIFWFVFWSIRWRKKILKLNFEGWSNFLYGKVVNDLWRGKGRVERAQETLSLPQKSFILLITAAMWKKERSIQLLYLPWKIYGKIRKL